MKRKSDLDHLVYIGIGSNIDDRTAFLTEAIRRMNADDNISITNISSIFESRPLGNKSVLPFLNGVVELTTKYLPSELFKNLQRFERGIGRKPRGKWAEREIDLDILLYDELLYADGALTIPHPEMINRDFVLTPLLELNGALCFPGTHTSFASFRDALQIRYIERRVPEITFEQYVGKRKLC